MADIEIICPKCGKHSLDADFCSECGAPIEAVSTPASAASAAGPIAGQSPAPQAALVNCPDCGEPRPGPASRFCDNCRYDFQERKSFAPVTATVPDSVTVTPQATAIPPVADPSASVAAAPADPSIAAAAPAFSVDALRSWELVVEVDATLRPSDAPPCPPAERRIFPLLEENLIGRHSEQQGIRPEIPLNEDTGISRRHARITREADGSVTLLDLDSANGTSVNGIPVKPHVPTPLKDGDSVTMGFWTRITVRAR